RPRREPAAGDVARHLPGDPAEPLRHHAGEPVRGVDGCADRGDGRSEHGARHDRAGRPADDEHEPDVPRDGDDRNCRLSARCRTRAAAAARALVEERGSRMSVRAGMAAALRVPSRASWLRFRWFVVEAGWWVLSVGIVIGIWEITAALGLINTIILPPPHKFVAEIRDQSQFLMPQPGVTAIPLHFAVFTAIGASVRRVLIGLLLGSLAAVLTGSLAFYLRLFRNLTFPAITMLAPIAPAAWIPLAFLGMAIIGLVGYLLDVGLGVLQKRVLWWRSAARV